PALTSLALSLDGIGARPAFNRGGGLPPDDAARYGMVFAGPSQGSPAACVGIRGRTAMRNPPRKVAFVLAASDHGTMLVSGLDSRMVDQRNGIGVGFQILERASYDAGEVDTVLNLLGLRRQYFGDGVTAVDCGANIGVHTVEWANRMAGWGQVIAIE